VKKDLVELEIFLKTNIINDLYEANIISNGQYKSFLKELDYLRSLFLAPKGSSFS
jgi:hypothetical protein